MTIEEKREKLCDYCERHTCNYSCPLYKFQFACSPYSDMTPDQIEEAYSIAFPETKCTINNGAIGWKCNQSDGQYHIVFTTTEKRFYSLVKTAVEVAVTLAEEEANERNNP